MADEIEGKIIQRFAADVAGRLNEAVVIARMADDFGKQGLTERAFLQASSVVRRRDRERISDLS